VFVISYLDFKTFYCTIGKVLISYEALQGNNTTAEENEENMEKQIEVKKQVSMIQDLYNRMDDLKQMFRQIRGMDDEDFDDDEDIYDSNERSVYSL